MSRYQTKIIKEYEKQGFIVLKNIRLNKSGFPDLQCLKDGKVKFIECKEKKDILSELQKLRIDQLINEGFEAFCLQDEKGIIYPIKK